jgi:hypothetical protein
VYVTLPELSVEGFHARETLYGVMPVTRRLVGVVGGCRSRAAATGATGRINTNTSRMATTAGSLKRSRVFIRLLLF